MRALASTVLLGLSLAACGPSGLGGPCGYPGEARGCTDDAICTPDVMPESPGGFDPTWASYSCRADCTSGQACEAGFECRPVPTREMVSTCQPVPADE